MIENLISNPYSDVYKLRDQLDEFELVKFRKLSDGPVAYTVCKAPECAEIRFKEILVPLAEKGVKHNVDTSLLKLQLDTNVHVAEDRMLLLLK